LVRATLSPKQLWVKPESVATGARTVDRSTHVAAVGQEYICTYPLPVNADPAGIVDAPVAGTAQAHCGIPVATIDPDDAIA